MHINLELGTPGIQLQQQIQFDVLMTSNDLK